MASYNDVLGSFNSLIDTLTNRLSIYFSAEVSSNWLGTMSRTAAIARSTESWSALPDPVPNGNSVVSELDSATRAIAVAAQRDDDESILAALKQANGALLGLEEILHISEQ